MSTFTPNFSLEKPALTDQADAEVWRDNTHKIVHAIKNIELETNAGFAQRSVSTIYKTAASSAVASNNFDTFWNDIDTSGVNWYNAGDATMGRLYQYTTIVGYQFEHPGIYRLSYNLRVQVNSTLHTEGQIRAAVYYFQGTLDPPVYIPGTHTQVPVDTYLGYTDIHCSTLVYVSEYDEVNRDTYNYGDDVGYSQNTAPNYQFEIRWNHNNSTADTATTVASGYNWFACEFVRAI